MYALSADQAKRAIDYFSTSDMLVVDTETFGLRPYHGDRLFSIILCDGKKVGYFNFLDYHDKRANVLHTMFLDDMRPLFAQKRLWVGHNLKFDMHMLWQEGIELDGTFHDTMVMERCLYYSLSEKNSKVFSLKETAARYGYRKDDAVDNYINAHPEECITKIPAPWRKAPIVKKHFDKVPFDIMIPYGEQDGISTYQVYAKQIAQIPEREKLIDAPNISFKRFYENEMKLVQTTFEIEREGMKISREFCNETIESETRKIEELNDEFIKVTQEVFKGGPNQYKRIFANIQNQWVWGKPTATGKVNPKFDADTLASFDHPAAKIITGINKASANIKVLKALLYHADPNDRIHSNLNQHLPVTGRFSSSEPNLQNIKKDPDTPEDREHAIRKAFVPEKDYNYFMLDYKAMEYIMMLDFAGPQELIQKVKDGWDIHDATAEPIGIKRSDAKAVNYGLLFGQGNNGLAVNIKRTPEEAGRIRNQVLDAAPEIRWYLDAVKQKLATRGYIYNWLGRIYEMPEKRTHYKGVNNHLQGGSADVMKVSMNRIRDYLKHYVDDVKFIGVVHDEAIFEAHKSTSPHVILKIKEIMDTAYKYRHIPLTVDVEYSETSLFDKEEWNA